MNKIFYILSILTIGILLSFTPTKKKIIVIDAGHGGNDKGASVELINEKDITLSIAKKIKELSKDKKDYEIILTRDSDVAPTLDSRVEKINSLNPDYVISLHMNNSTDKTLNGMEIFIQENEASKKIAESVGEVFTISKLVGRTDLKLLNGSKAPAIIIELGFLSNETDRKNYASEEGQNTFAEKFIYFLDQKK